MPQQLNITSANSVYMLSVAGVFPTPQQIQGFAVNEAFDTEAAETAVLELGVDGFTAAGWVPRLTKQTVVLLAASPSFLLFEAWIAAQDVAQNTFTAQGTIILPGLGRQYSLPNGYLTRFPALPNARRVLEQRTFEITWSWPITSAPI